MREAVVGKSNKLSVALVKLINEVSRPQNCEIMKRYYLLKLKADT